jgi:hypothetical protein
MQQGLNVTEDFGIGDLHLESLANHVNEHIPIQHNLFPEGEMNHCSSIFQITSVVSLHDTLTKTLRTMLLESQA